MATNPEMTIGSKALDFKLESTTGNPVGLEDYLNRKNVYLFFVREFN